MKKILLAFLAMSLVSCTNTRTTVSPDSTPIQSTPNDSNDANQSLSTIEYSGEAKTGNTISLVAKDSNGALIVPQSAVTYTVTKGNDLVSIDESSVNLLKTGDVTIQGSYEGITKEVSFTIVEGYTQIKDITENTAYSIKGQVVGKNTQGFLVSDGIATIYVYQGRNPKVTVNLNDFVSVKGAVTEYNGAKQFPANAEISVESTGTPVNNEATPLTKEIADSFAIKDKKFATTDIKLYTWTATAGKTGSYTTLNLDGSSTVIEPVYFDSTAFVFEEGNKYEVEAYFTGYSFSYASVLLTKAKELKGIKVSIDKTSIKAGDPSDFAQITVVPTGGYELGTTTYTSSDDTIATVDESGKVIGLKASTTPVEITVTNGEYSAKISISVTPSNSVEYTINFDDSFNKDFITISDSKVEKTLDGGVNFVHLRNTGSAIRLNSDNTLQYPGRVYTKHSITFTAPQGKTFSAISFVSKSSNAFNSSTASTEQGAINDNGIVTLNNSVSSITFTAIKIIYLTSVTYTIG